MPTITYLDVEASQNTHSSKRKENWKVVEIGAVQNGKTFRGKEVEDFKTFIQGSEYLCGHNLVDHDLELLRQAGLGTEVSNTIAIGVGGKAI